MTRHALLALLALAPLSLAAGSVGAEGLRRDSADWVCHHGAVADPRTLDACARLQGEAVTYDQVLRLRRGGHARDSADLVCHHGDPADPRTADACARLEGDPAVQPWARRRS